MDLTSQQLCLVLTSVNRALSMAYSARRLRDKGGVGGGGGVGDNYSTFFLLFVSKKNVYAIER